MMGFKEANCVMGFRGTASFAGGLVVKPQEDGNALWLNTCIDSFK